MTRPTDDTAGLWKPAVALCLIYGLWWPVLFLLDFLCTRSAR